KVVSSLEAEAAAATTAATGGIKFSDAAQAIIDKQAKLDAQFQSAQAILKELNSGYEAGAVSAQTLARAEEGLTSAANAAGQSISKYGVAAQDIISAQARLNQNF